MQIPVKLRHPAAAQHWAGLVAKMEEAKKSVCEEKVNFLFCGQSVSRPTGQMATRTPGIWKCSYNVGLTCENFCATHLLHMSYGCAAHVHLFVCIGALETLEHWSFGHIEALEHWTLWPNKGWMPGRWLFGAWAMSWFSTLAAPLGWSGREKKGNGTPTQESWQKVKCAESNHNFWRTNKILAGIRMVFLWQHPMLLSRICEDWWVRQTL